MFIAALFIIAKIWKQPTCLLIDEWIKNMWYGEEDGRGLRKEGTYVKKNNMWYTHTCARTHTHTPSLDTPFQTMSISYL